MQEVFNSNGHEYSFSVDGSNQSQTEAVQFMRGLYTGERQLEELTQEQLFLYSVELTRYQTSAEFPDDPADDRAVEMQVAYGRQVMPVFTEYRDETGQTHLAEVITDGDGEGALTAEDSQRATEISNNTHRGLIRNTLVELTQRMINPDHAWGDATHYSREEAELFMTYAGIIRDMAENSQPLGEQELPSWLQGTYRYDMDVLPSGDVVVGEKHVRMIQNDQYEILLKQRMERFASEGSGVLVVENADEKVASGWRLLSKYPPWMSVAMEQARAIDLQIVGLDGAVEASKSLSPELTERWSRHGFSEADIYTFAVLWKARAEVVRQQLVANVSLETIAESLIIENGWDRSQMGVIKGVLSAVKIAETDPEVAIKLNRLLELSVVQIDSCLREEDYSARIVELKNQGKKVFAVVGRGHHPAMVETLKTGKPISRYNPLWALEFDDIVKSLDLQGGDRL